MKLEVVNDENWKLIKDMCKERFEKYSNPCRTCKYRSMVRKDFCIWGNCPHSWKENDN